MLLEAFRYYVMECTEIHNSQKYGLLKYEW